MTETGSPPKGWIADAPWNTLENIYWAEDGPAGRENLNEVYTFLSSDFYLGGANGMSYEALTPEEIRLVLDWGSMVGRHAPGYTVGGEPDQYGGLGSENYETQYVGEGVAFTKEPIWHYPSDGPELVNDVPPNCGAYHYSPERGSQVAGPEPESEAAALLGDGSYTWSSEQGLYLVES